MFCYQRGGWVQIVKYRFLFNLISEGYLQIDMSSGVFTCKISNIPIALLIHCGMHVQEKLVRNGFSIMIMSALVDFNTYWLYLLDPS